MDELSVCRKEIDTIDAQLIALFEQRMQISTRVSDYKKSHNLPILQSGREQEVLRQAADSLKDKSYTAQAHRLMTLIMELSRAVQHSSLSTDDTYSEKVCASLPDGTVAFQGVAGSFSEQALIAIFGEARTRAEYPEFRDVFCALQKGEAVCGVLPIENSSTGSITQVYDLLGAYGFFIVGEYRLEINQNLVGLPNASIDTIKTVYSHSQGLEQSSAFLEKHRDWQTIHFHNTAASAQLVAQSDDCSKAAICSERAAALYGLQIIAPAIQDNRHNTTRFIVISRSPLVAGVDKISIAFSLDDKSGSLFGVLRHFSEGGFNMVKIESRPIPDILWNYRFFVDFEGDPADPAVKALLETLSCETSEFQFLGGCKYA